MPLFVDQTQGYKSNTEIDLHRVAMADGKFRTVSVVGDSTVSKVVYEPASSGFGQELLNTVVNVLPLIIVVTAVDNAATVNGRPITTFAGVTLCEGPILRVIYDVSQGGGCNYFVFNTAGTKISFPNSVLIGHELSHCIHIANGHHRCSPFFRSAVAAAELLAITDENALRLQNGLEFRDVNNPNGGCGLS